MLKRILILCGVAIVSQAFVFAQDSDLFTIYLVRHSEKDLSSEMTSDLPLSRCGELRSEALSEFLQDVDIEIVYSTDYTRTRDTAAPTAEDKGLIPVIYHSSNLVELSKELLIAKQSALVVGHSNTTAVLAGLLVGENLGDIDLDIYDRVYQVVICGDSRQLTLFHSSFECGE